MKNGSQLICDWCGEIIQPAMCSSHTSDKDFHRTCYDVYEQKLAEKMFNVPVAQLDRALVS